MTEKTSSAAGRDFLRRFYKAYRDDLVGGEAYLNYLEESPRWDMALSECETCIATCRAWIEQCRQEDVDAYNERYGYEKWAWWKD